MVNLSDIFDLALFDEMVAQKYVRVQTHPTLPLVLCNYSELCQFNRVWNPVTINCRGLVYNIANKQVVARPFSKFYNYSEPESAHLDLNAKVEVTDKADGSLGVLWQYNNEWHISTRGSFQSEQAIHANKVWRDKYEGKFTVVPGYTYLFEIVYAQNRLVVNYGDMDDLVMIGVVENDTGRSLHNVAELSRWPGPSAKVFEYKSLAQALAAEPRDNAEGFVVHFLETDERAKIKQEDYVRLHRIVTGLSERSVWQHMVDGKPIEKLIEPLPEEFADWIREVWWRIADDVDNTYYDIFAEFTEIQSTLPEEYSRKDFAMAAVNSPHKWALFGLLDGRDILPELLKRARPEAITPAGKLVEETI